MTNAGHDLMKLNALVDRLIVVNKHSGPTSFDVVDAFRRATGIRKVGHTGTLDPLASGVLLLCTGRATRAVEQFMDLAKTYEFTVRLGVETTTLDAEGDVVSRAAVPALPAAEIEAAAASFIGEYDMSPPAYSALKHNGKRLYELARAGKSPEVASRRVTIHEIAVVRIELPDIDVRVRCSRGTYVRSIARDLGAQFGLPAHLTQLVRTGIGSFAIDDAYPCERLFEGDVTEIGAVPLSQALDFLPGVVLNDVSRRALVDGALPHGEDIVDVIGPVAKSNTLRLLDRSGALLAIGRRSLAGVHNGVPLIQSFRLLVDRRSVMTG